MDDPPQQPEPPEVAVLVQGEDAMTGAVKAGAAMLNLLDALTEEIAPDSGLRWRVGSMGWCCDRCGLQVGVERPDDWTRDGSDDLCGECSRASPP
jgi:hypothetical protein